MKNFDTDIVAEVRNNREELLKQYGGIEGLHKHMEQERPQLEKDGWQFVSISDILSRKSA